MILAPKVLSKTVATAGTREQLTTANLRVASVVIQASPSNTGIVYVGDNQVSSSVGIALNANSSITFSNDDLGEGDAKIALNKIWVDVSVGGEGVSILYLERTD
jgi:hypothetical protein